MLDDGSATHARSEIQAVSLLVLVIPKLMINLGIRWDPYFPYTEQKGRVPQSRGRGTVLNARLNNRNRKVEDRTDTGLGFDPDAATMLLDDFLAGRESNAGTFDIFAMQAFKDSEDVCLMFGSDSLAIVADRELNLVADLIG